MSLKLFRSTGYSSLLAPGETRVAMHPGWLVVAISLWVGLACNVGLWRALAAGSGPALVRALALGVLMAALAAMLLSLLGWRRTLKSAAFLITILAALAACAWWLQPAPADGGLWHKEGGMLPAWPGLRWQLLVLPMALALPPLLWLRRVQLRRLPGSTQFSVNATGALLGGAVVAASAFVLGRLAA